MSKDSKTPQAFPYSGEGDELNYSKGMTLRDYAAIKAMQSLMTNFLARELNEVDPNGWMEGLAMDSYSMADAMLKARAR